MKYVIKLTLERDDVQEKEWAIGCQLPNSPTERELFAARRGLFLSVRDRVSEELENDIPQ